MLTYTPPKSLEGFLTADKFTNLVVGPYGSTKTTAGVIKIAYEARRIAPCHDGVRRSRYAWIRNTNEQLRDTSIPDFLKWFPDGRAGTYMRTERKFMLKFDDVECEVLFRGLDDTNDVRRLLSLQLTGGIMDEFREVNKDIFEALGGRVGRYPDKSMNGVGACDDAGLQIDKVWGMSNPPDYGTFWEEYLSNPPTNAAVFIQPSGISPEADWLHYLKPGYYENLVIGKSQDWIDVYVNAKFGKSLSGQPVFRSFERGINVGADKLNVLGTQVVIGVDAGLNPSACVTQMTYDGRVLVHDVLTGATGGMGALRFCREMLKPLVAAKYPTHPIAVVVDPAAFQRAQTDERSVADIFKQEGFSVRPALSNSIAARLAAVEKYLTMSVNGNAGLLIDPGCDLLIRALGGKYRYKVNTRGEVDNTPEKSHPHSDVCDALQYACLHHDKGSLFGKSVAVQPQQVERADMTAWI